MCQDISGLLCAVFPIVLGQFSPTSNVPYEHLNDGIFKTLNLVLYNQRHENVQKVHIYSKVIISVGIKSGF
jgi:hypothetical protein